MNTRKLTFSWFGAALLICALTGRLQAQTLPVGLLENVEDSYRRQQLLGKDSSNSSYMIRPINISYRNNITLGSNSKGKPITLDNFRSKLYVSPKGQIAFYFLPVVLEQQTNTHHPYGMNDGSMIQARGYQTQFSAGFSAKIGPLSIQLRPEYVFADNTDFQTLTEAPNETYTKPVIANYYNKIDLPDRFGDGNYEKLSWGQSSVRLSAGPVSVGLSNENLWWGPGVRNSLLMSNNASGFKHFSLNTTRPIKTYIGSFEAQVVSGRLEQSGVIVSTSKQYKVKPIDWRYFSGIVLTYQPKLFPGLYLGLDRVYTINRGNMGRGFKDYFPIFGALPKDAYVNPDNTNSEDTADRDQMLSFFARYVLPESEAEVYFEWGRNDHAYDTRDAVVEPEHSRAYVVGFRKLVPLKSTDAFIQLGIEFTQMQKGTTRETRDTPSWYIHSQVQDGYTNNGQILGAGIGPGSNLQSLDVSWVKGLKRIGLQFERMIHNNDLFYNMADASPNKNVFINRHWVDLSVGSKLAWNFNRFVLNSEITYIRSLNYQYQWMAGPDYWVWPKQDVNNYHLKLGALYSF